MRKRSEIGKTPTPAPEESKPTGAQVTCPKCGLVQPTGTSDCLGCGTVFAKYEPENLSKLAYDLKAKDLDITIADLASLEVASREVLREWVESKTSTIPANVRAILEHIKVTTPKPLIQQSTAPSEDIFKNYVPTPEEARGRTSNVTNTTIANTIKIIDDPIVGEEVTYVLGKEMYRVTEFCTFDVGPYSATTRIRANETRAEALHRIRADLESVAEIDRVARRDSYIRTYLGIAPALKAASDSRKG